MKELIKELMLERETLTGDKLEAFSALIDNIKHLQAVGLVVTKIPETSLKQDAVYRIYSQKFNGDLKSQLGIIALVACHSYAVLWGRVE